MKNQITKIITTIQQASIRFQGCNLQLSAGINGFYAALKTSWAVQWKTQCMRQHSLKRTREQS